MPESTNLDPINHPAGPWAVGDMFTRTQKPTLCYASSMTPTEYSKGAMRTDCNYEAVFERLLQQPKLLNWIENGLLAGITTGVIQDGIKKHLMYGTPLKEKDTEALNATAPPSEAILQKLMQPDLVTIRLLHAFLGSMTETAEKQEALFRYLFKDEPCDVVNLIEEAGDGHWYDALLYKAIGSSFEEAMTKNLAKLQARYPVCFTEDLATSRDLATERQVLEIN